RVAENTTDGRESSLSGIACSATTAKTRERRLLAAVRYTSVKIADEGVSERSVQRPGEGLAAQVLGGLRRFLEELGQGLGDVLEDLAVLLGGQARRDADVAHEELVVFGPHRKSPQLR